MAALVSAVPESSMNNVDSKENIAEKEEKLLYDENSEVSNEKESTTVLENDEVKENGVIKEEENGDDEEGDFEDSDDEEDDINVHIGEVNASNQFGNPWKKDGAQAAAAAAAAAKPGTAPAATAQGQKKIDVNAVGMLNGQPIYEYDIDNDQDDKPWRKPGADISDYFNYGFTEDTWKQYCEKQRRMRSEAQRAPYTVAAAPGIPPPVAAVAQPQQIELEVLPDGRTRVKAGPPPDRKVEGAIHVLGSDVDARRKQKEEELLALALGTTRVIPQPFQQQRMYTALPHGGMVYNNLGQHLPPGSQPDMNTVQSSEGLNTSQGQQIQSMGAPSAMASVMPPTIQYLPAGAGPLGMQIGPGGAPIFPPPNTNMDFGGGDHFSNMPPPHNFRNSDSEFDSDGESRRHRSRRESSRHRRHRDRSDRDRDRERGSRDRDRDRSRTDHRDRSSSKRRHESRSTSDRKKHSSRSASSRPEEDEEKKSKRKVKTEVKEEPIDEPTSSEPSITPIPTD